MTIEKSIVGKMYIKIHTICLELLACEGREKIAFASPSGFDIFGGLFFP